MIDIGWSRDSALGQPVSSSNLQSFLEHLSAPIIIMSTEIPLMKNILISGGTGFVGSAIARELAEKHPECRITIIDLNPPGPHHVVPGGVSFIRIDVTEPDEVQDAVSQVKPDIVIHTAGIVPVLSERFGRRLERKTWKINVDGTKHMLQAAKSAGVQGFIYTSTCCVTTDDMRTPLPNIDERWPTSPSSLIYGESKVFAKLVFLMPLTRIGCCRSFGSGGMQ